MLYSFDYTRQRNPPDARSHARDRQPHTRQRNREPAQTARKYRLTRKTDGVSFAGDQQRHTRRGNPPRQQELHTTQPAPPKHPTQRHTRQQASCLPLKPDRAHRKLRGQGLSDLPPQSEPAERRRKASEKLAETSASPDQSIGVASSFQTSFA